MIKKILTKSGSTGPGPLLVFVILVIVIILIFFGGSFFSTFLPENQNDGLSTEEDTSGDEETLNLIDKKTLSQGVYSSYNESGGLIIENDSNLKTLWAQTSGGSPPDIDFDHTVVLAAFAGDKSTGGYSIRIDEVLQEDNRIAVNVIVVTPGGSCSVASSITNPYQIVSMVRQDLPIEFVSYDEVEECD